MSTDLPGLASSFCGLRFNTPLVLLSGCVGFGDEYTRVEGFSHADVGAVFLKGTTAEPRLGNRTHRIAETPSGMLNSIGLQNPGIDALIADILPRLDHAETHYIPNISGSTIDEYRELTARLDDSPVNAIEINISCPNVDRGGAEFGNDPEMSARVVAACRSQTRKPLITKLSPNQADIGDNAKRCLEAGSDAFSVINTVSGMAIDIETRTPVLDNICGGLSGPAIKPIALLKVFEVHQVCKPHNIPIIGQGGVTGTADVIEFLIAGAAAVGIGTGLFYDPLLCRRINSELLDYLGRKNITDVNRLVGSLQSRGHPQE